MKGHLIDDWSIKGTGAIGMRLIEEEQSAFSVGKQVNPRVDQMAGTESGHQN